MLNQTPVRNDVAEMHFNAVYQLYSEKVWKYAVGYTKSSQEANDIMQEVFLKVWLEFDRFEKIENQLSYLYSMTRNIFLNIQKKIKRKQARFFNYCSTCAVADYHDVPLFNEYYNVFIDAVINLPQRQQQVFILKELGYKRRVVSASLKISENTVDSHLQLAWRNVKDYVSQKLAIRMNDDERINNKNKSWPSAA